MKFWHWFFRRPKLVDHVEIMAENSRLKDFVHRLSQETVSKGCGVIVYTNVAHDAQDLMKDLYGIEPKSLN